MVTGDRFASGDFGDVDSVEKYRRSLVRSHARLPVALMEILSAHNCEGGVEYEGLLGK
jgi:hypothetical protein